MRIKKGDTVYIRKGTYRGKTGRVLFVDTKKKVILVEGINMKNKHQRPTQKNPKGGIIKMENSINISNVALYNSSLSAPTKFTSRVLDDGGKKRKIRVCVKTGEEI
ncbi:MAG: 50S ribosomal protein L24 [Candidatus Zixiibacteriota bacterium]